MAQDQPIYLVYVHIHTHMNFLTLIKMFQRYPPPISRQNTLGLGEDRDKNPVQRVLRTQVCEWDDET